MNTQEQAICTAPRGQLRIVYVDPRDHWPNVMADVRNMAEVRRTFEGHASFTCECMVVYDDQGNQVELTENTSH